MDKINNYRQLIKQLLQRYTDLINNRPVIDIKSEFIADEERDHYMLLTTGWIKTERIRGTTLYVRLRDGKFWIEEDWTEQGIATDLLELGVPKEDIILAFHPPEVRQYTEFAVA